jgi:hypothetical protein
MDKRVSNWMFLLGVAPLAVGCQSRAPARAGADGSDSGGGSESGESSTSAGNSTTDTGDSTTDTGDSTTTDGGSDDDICLAYSEIYGGCFGEMYQQEVLEFCEEYHAWYQMYASPACLAAWEGFRICVGGLECGPNPLVACAEAIDLQIQECYYNDGLYLGCDLYGMLVAECVDAAAGEAAEAQCDATYEQLYEAYYGTCGDAYEELYVCISKLDCAALEDPALIEAGCGPELAAKEQECSP